MPDVGEMLLADLIYKDWKDLDTRQKNRKLPEQIQAVFSLTKKCTFGLSAIKKAIKAVRKRVTREESESRYNLAHELQEEAENAREEAERVRI